MLGDFQPLIGQIQIRLQLLIGLFQFLPVYYAWRLSASDWPGLDQIAVADWSLSVLTCILCLETFSL